jgi:DNA adenine methylase
MNYMGGKFRQGPTIIQFLEEVLTPEKTYVEPFCGSMWVASRMNHKRMILSDVSRCLMSMWAFFQHNTDFVLPDEISEDEYNEVKKVRDPDDWKTAYYGFGMSFGSRFFASYVKPEARIGKGGTNKAKTLKNSTDTKRLNLFRSGKDVSLFNCDYRELKIPPNSVIYCDPPYANAGDIHDSEPFDSEVFWNNVRSMVYDGHIVLVTEFTVPDDFEVLYNFGNTLTMAVTKSVHEVLVCHNSQKHLFKTTCEMLQRQQQQVAIPGLTPAARTTTKESFIELIEDEFTKILELTRSKGEEYSRSDDQLANFKRNAVDLGLTPEQVWSVYFNKHIDSIKSYVGQLSKTNNPAMSEPIESRVSDAILYLLLFKAMLNEKR